MIDKIIQLNNYLGELMESDSFDHVVTAIILLLVLATALTVLTDVIQFFMQLFSPREQTIKEVMELVQQYNAIQMKRIDTDDGRQYFVETPTEEFIVNVVYLNKKRTKFKFERLDSAHHSTITS